ncbi:MAG: DegV family protein [Oscillospiraceae bacterium]
MNRKYLIAAEVTVDLPGEFINENNLLLLPITYMINDVEYGESFNNVLPTKEFYDMLRNGSMPKTAAVTPDAARTAYQKAIDDNCDILYLGFSSGLSGSFNNSVRVLNELKELNPEFNFRAIDTLSASSGQGILVHLAINFKNAGKTLDEAADWLEKHVQNQCHYFTVNDLNHLHRGGRVSKTAAVIGSVLGIKPVLHVDENGKLIPVTKVRGRKQSLDALVDKMGSKLGSYKNEFFYVSHGDSREDAEYVVKQVKSRFGIKTAYITDIGPVIGTHSGAGTIALFFIGTNRTEKY